MVSNVFLSAEGSNSTMTWVFVALLVVLVILLLVVPMFTNKKRAKQTIDLHNSLQPGDVVKTVGGIIGTIKEIRQVSPTDREMVLETGDGDNKTTMTFDIQALYQILSRVNAPAPAPTPDNSKKEEAVFDEVQNNAAEKSEPAPQAEGEVKAEEKADENKVEEPVATEDNAKAEAVKAANENSEKPADETLATKAPKSNSAQKTAAKKKTTNSGAKTTK